MVKAFLLILGASAYLASVQWGNDAATAGLAHVQNLYTNAGAEAAAISASNR